MERCYQELSGHPLRDMDFYLTYAAVRHAIAMARVKRRMIRFGEDQVPEDPDDYVMHRASLEKLVITWRGQRLVPAGVRRCPRAAARAGT